MELVMDLKKKKKANDAFRDLRESKFIECL